MSELLLRVALGNFTLSALLAGLAWCVQRTGRRPQLAHFLWLLVLAKLVTPPLWSLPLWPGDTPGAETAADLTAAELIALTEGPVLGEELLPLEPLPLAAVEPAATGFPWGTALLAVWGLGSLFVLAGSLLRLTRFHRLVAAASRPADGRLQRMAEQLAARLGLRRVPEVRTSPARLSPMVWGRAPGARPCVLLPEALVGELPAGELRWVLAHELAHVRRRDHLVRWLEWAACIAFWWNPLAWVARRELRANEEICCDALVLVSLGDERDQYASTLLRVAEFLSAPVLRPPAIASAIQGGGSLHRRFTMILSDTRPRKVSAALRVATLLCAGGLLSVGVVQAQDARPGEPGVERNAATTDPVLEALRELLAAGEISTTDAVLVYETVILPKSATYHGLQARITEVSAKLDIEVSEGGLTPAEAEAKRDAYVAEMRSLAFFMDVHGLSKEEAAQRMSLERVPGTKRVPKDQWMASTLLDAGLPPATVERVVPVALKLSHVLGKDDEAARLLPEFTVKFAEMGLDPYQIELVVGIAERLAKTSRTVAKKSSSRIVAHLAEAGVPEDRLKHAVELVDVIAQHMAAEGEAFVLDPAMHQQLLDLGLTGEQMEVVLELARRGTVAPSHAGEHEWMVALMGDSGLTEVQVKQVLGAIELLVPPMLEQGAEFVLAPDMQHHLLAEVGLDAHQLELTLHLAQRTVEKKLHEEHKQRTFLEELRRKLDHGVALGEITPEEAREMLVSVELQLAEDAKAAAEAKEAAEAAEAKEAAEARERKERAERTERAKAAEGARRR